VAYGKGEKRDRLGEGGTREGSLLEQVFGVKAVKHKGGRGPTGGGTCPPQVKWCGRGKLRRGKAGDGGGLEREKEWPWGDFAMGKTKRGVYFFSLRATKMANYGSKFYRRTYGLGISIRKKETKRRGKLKVASQ